MSKGRLVRVFFSGGLGWMDIFNCWAGAGGDIFLVEGFNPLKIKGGKAIPITLWMKYEVRK